MPTRTKVIVSNAFNLYIQHPDRPTLSQRSRDVYSRFYRHFLANIPETMRKANVQTMPESVAQDYCRKLGETTNPRTYNQMVCFLRAIWRLFDPFRKVWPAPNKPCEQHSHLPLTDGELSAILLVATGEWHLLFRVGAATGLRLGDCCCLKKEALNTETKELILVPRKTCRNARYVHIPVVDDQLLFDLKRIKEDGSDSPYFMPTCAEKYERSQSRTSHIVHSLFEQAGIAQRGKCFHSLRHRFVTRAAERGVPLLVIQEVVGHGNPLMTKLYSHVGGDVIRNAMIKML